MSERSQDRALTTLEAALRELHPRPCTLDRAVLMYCAGRASVRGWFWPVATAAATTFAVAFAVLWMIRPASPLVERIVYLPAPATEPQLPVDKPPQSTPPPAPEPFVMQSLDSSLQGRSFEMEESVLRWGLKGIPPPPLAPPLPEAPTVEQLLRSL